jgi:hypothetical protein
VTEELGRGAADHPSRRLVDIGEAPGLVEDEERLGDPRQNRVGGEVAASLDLALIEVLVPDAVELVEGGAVLGCAGPADAVVDPRLERLADPGQHSLHGFAIGVGQEHRELIPAEAGHGAPGADGVGELSRRPAQQLVSRTMAVGVVVGLEEIEVDDHQGHRALIAPEVAEGGIRRLRQAAAVEQSRQGVRLGAASQLQPPRLMQAGLPDGHHGGAGEDRAEEDGIAGARRADQSQLQEGKLGEGRDQDHPEEGVGERGVEGR